MYHYLTDSVRLIGCGGMAEYNPALRVWECKSGMNLSAMPGQYELIEQAEVPLKLKARADEILEEEQSAPAPVAPEEPAPSEPVYPVLSPIQFKLLFTPQERIAGQAARATDPVMEDIYSILEDPRLTEVDLGLQSTQDMLLYLESKGIITDGRRKEILTGVLK